MAAMIEFLLRFLIGLLIRYQNRESLKTLGAARSPEWRRVRAEHIRRYPACAVCGETRKAVEVHHIVPFHQRPELELDPRNLITLCESGANGIVCHRAVGHLGSYQSFNENVREDAKVWNQKLLQRP